MASVSFRAEQYEKALQYIDKAIPLLKCFYGDRHDGITELGTLSRDKHRGRCDGRGW